MSVMFFVVDELTGGLKVVVV